MTQLSAMTLESLMRERMKAGELNDLRLSFTKDRYLASYRATSQFERYDATDTDPVKALVDALLKLKRNRRQREDFDFG
jgi:hypothetical protein